MSFELPIFPLNVVLFPGMPLPLHIFEPRYRLMIERCLEADRAFGVTQMVETSENATSEPARVGTVAEIIDVTPFADGRMNLQTIGTRRFEILLTRQQDDYLVATCQWLEDEPEADGLQAVSWRTRRVLDRYFHSLAANAGLPVEWGEVDVPQQPYSLSMFIAAIIALPADQKQMLLEMTSTQNRLELEEFLLERADLVQRAFTKHTKQGFLKPPSDASSGQFSNFASPN